MHHELEGTQTLIDRELVEMRGDLHRLRAPRRGGRARATASTSGELASQLAATGRSTQALADTTQSLREALSSSTARGSGASAWPTTCCSWRGSSTA